VLKWLADQVEQLPSLVESLLPKQADDILELDELWAFVYQRDNERWLWTALCRRTRQIVAFVIGGSQCCHLPTVVASHPARLSPLSHLHRLLEGLSSGPAQTHPSSCG
jgi:hypothetical protein